jgi:dephospho-CoA kinase
MSLPFCVGLTGGIGSGKSSAARIFAELGAAVVDTDDIAHQLTGAGGLAVPAIASEFGEDYLAADGALDRAKMRHLVFSDPAARERLERILHPLIRAESHARIAAATHPYVIVVVPLLLETGAYRTLIQRILVVDCEEALQIRRTMERSGLSEAGVRAIMATQVPRATRLAAADDVLNNDTDRAALRRSVETLHAHYLKLAARHAADTQPTSGSS